MATDTADLGALADPLGMSDDMISQLQDAGTESAFRGSGAGSYHSAWGAVMSRVDRFGYNPLPPNHDMSGLTFFTRPKLNLTTANLRQDRVMATLDTQDPTSFPFALRCYLDTKYSRRSDVSGDAKECPFFNSDLPFLVPLTNCIQNISGFPDFVLDMETSEGGYFNENQTHVRGSDMNLNTFDLTVTFREIQGGPIMSMFLYWCRYIALVCKGQMIAYPEDIEAHRIPWTISIYRLVLDPSKRFIAKWGRATGCIPRFVPIGNSFNFTDREAYLQSTGQFSIQFMCNSFESFDPILFAEFNQIVKKYAGDPLAGRVAAPAIASNNFAGIPYIDLKGSNELKFMALPEEMQDPAEAIIQRIQQQLVSSNTNLSSSYSDTTASPVDVAASSLTPA